MSNSRAKVPMNNKTHSIKSFQQTLLEVQWLWEEAKPKHFFQTPKRSVKEVCYWGKTHFRDSHFFCRKVDPHSVGVRCVLFDFFRQVMWKRGS